MTTNPGKVATYNKELASFHKDTFYFSGDLVTDFDFSYTICSLKRKRLNRHQFYVFVLFT